MMLFVTLLWELLLMPMTNMKHNIALSVTNHTDTESALPSEDDYARWLQHALQSKYSNVIIDILLCDKNEIATLNINYRAKAKPTNVLSFPQSDVPNYYRVISHYVHP